MTRVYDPCDYTLEAGRCGLPVKIEKGRRPLCPEHRARMPYWPTDDAPEGCSSCGSERGGRCEACGPDVEPTLRERLTSYVCSESIWANLAEHGATDQVVAEYVMSEYHTDEKRPTAEEAAALVPEVRQLFGIGQPKEDLRALSVSELLDTIKRERETWRASGRSPLHERINVIVDERGEELLRAAGWPTHDGAPYRNDHTGGLETYAGEVTRYLDEHATKRGETRGTRVRYLVEHWAPVWPDELVGELESARARLLKARASAKPPKGAKVRPDWKPYDVEVGEKAVALLEAELARIGAAIPEEKPEPGQLLLLEG